MIGERGARFQTNALKFITVMTNKKTDKRLGTKKESTCTWKGVKWNLMRGRFRSRSETDQKTTEIGERNLCYILMGECY